MIPSWLLFALLSPAIYTIVNFTDKYLLESKVKDYRGMFVYGCIAAFFIGILLWIITGFPLLSPKDTVLVILTGVFSIWASVIYFRVMQKEDASTVVFLFQAIPIFVLIMSFLFLREPISSKQLFGFFLILLSSLTIVNEGKFFTIKVNSTLLLMLIVDMFWASGQVLFKFVSETNSFSKLVSFESIGWTIGGSIVFLASKQVRNAFYKTTKSVTKPTLGVIFGNEFVFVVAKLINFFAVSLGPVALVSVLGGTQVFFGIIYGWALTLLAPHIFKENISKKGLMGKFFLAVIMIIGIWLIY